MQTVILAIGLLIFFSYAAAGLFARTRIPDVLPLTLLGIVLGPVLGWSHPTDFGSVGAVMSLVALKGLFRVVLGPKQTTSSQGSVPAG